MSYEEKIQESRTICNYLLRDIVWRESHTVIAYYPLWTEPNILPLLATAMHGGKDVYFPVAHRIPLAFLHFLEQFPSSTLFPLAQSYSFFQSQCKDRHDRKSSAFHDFSCAMHNLQHLRSPLLILVPGLAFSRRGHRLGRGWAFYDQLCNRISCFSMMWIIGVCFSRQIMDLHSLVEEHDYIFSHVITNQGKIICK